VRGPLSRVATRLTYANVVSTVALVAALGTGTAYAANTVGTDDIIDGQVMHQDLDAAAVAGDRIADGSVGGADIADGSVGGADIADGSVGGADLADGSVGSADIANGSVSSADIADGSVGGGDIADGSVRLTDLSGVEFQGQVSFKAKTAGPGRCTPRTVTVPGARSGQVVLLSTLAKLQSGVVLSAQQVVADDTVQVEVCNFRTSRMKAIVRMPVRVVTFD
jgi:hypothetical protein